MLESLHDEPGRQKSLRHVPIVHIKARNTRIISLSLLFWTAIFCTPVDYNLDTGVTVPNCVENWKRSLSVNGLHYPISYLTPALGQHNTAKWPLSAATLIRSLCVPRWRTSGYREKELVKCDERVQNTANSKGVKFNWNSTVSTSVLRTVL